MQIRHVAAATLMVIVLTGAAACSGGDSSSSSPSGNSTGSTGIKKPAGAKPSTPKGPRTTLKGMDICKVLRDESLTAIAVEPSDAREGSESGRSSDSGCDWQSGGTEVQINAIIDMSVDMSVDEYGIQKKIDVLGFPGIAATALGNSCDVSMQVNADELEVNVRNEDSSNQALQGSKACDVAKDFTRQVLTGVTKK
ncbi:DUF3558 family protein [Streptomyces sp. NPDC053427]|uniref:DUF3558 family protein n=1 Tax=Streptomyces sp. NPDC053427 TaxID=3365701 RepID=UPI0037D73511